MNTQEEKNELPFEKALSMFSQYLVMKELIIQVIKDDEVTMAENRLLRTEEESDVERAERLYQFNKICKQNKQTQVDINNQLTLLTPKVTRYLEVLPEKSVKYTYTTDDGEKYTYLFSLALRGRLEYKKKI